MTDTITIPRPYDMHVHLREAKMLYQVLPFTARHFTAALVMPNLRDPVTTAGKAKAYRENILGKLSALDKKCDFTPIMTIKLTQRTTHKDIADASGIALAAKLYPTGVTTNSDDGVSDPNKLDSVLQAMSDYGMVLSVHAEEPGVFCLSRERVYLDRVRDIARKHPKLHIVVEHVTSEDGVDFIRYAGPNVAATITVHHLFMTLDDVVGDKLEPHNFCKPIPKHRKDRQYLRNAALNGEERFFLGTDSAPHAVDDKECAHGCAGCFTSPVALPLLAELFGPERVDALTKFTSTNAAKFYNLPEPKETITLERKTWEPRKRYFPAPAVIFRGDQEMMWDVVES